MRLSKVLLGAALTAASGLAADYKLTLVEPLTVQGMELTPGEYKVQVNDSNVKIYSSKQSVDATAKVETSEKKYDNTSVGYTNGDGKHRLRELTFRGSTTRLIFAE